jgi:hypothetical protein
MNKIKKVQKNQKIWPVILFGTYHDGGIASPLSFGRLEHLPVGILLRLPELGLGVMACPQQVANLMVQSPLFQARLGVLHND